MPQKIGGGGRPQPYEKSNGRYIDGVGKSQEMWMPKMVKGGLYDGAGSEDDGYCFSTQRRVHTQAEEGQSKKAEIDELEVGRGYQSNKFNPTPEERKLLKKRILSLEPITLKIGNKEIIAEFDKHCAKKNAYAQGNSDNEGYQYKFLNFDELLEHMKKSTYLRSSAEKGKGTPQHQGVILWHYFVGKIRTNNEVLYLVMNVRDKGTNKYVYEISLKKEKS